MSTSSRRDWFDPDALRPLYRVYAVLLLVASGAVPVAVAALVADSWVAVALGATTLAVLAFLWWWTAAYDDSVAYRLTEDAVESRGGVFFQSRKTVPYGRITNVEAKQGPLSRYFGVGSVAIQTAGQGAQSTAELTMRALVDYEDVKDDVLTAVQGHRDEDDGTGAPRDARTADPLLAEVRAIRERLDAMAGDD